MRSVADRLRDETRHRTLALSPAERVRLALELGDADVAAVAEAQGVGTAEARAVIARSRRIGRRPSKAHGD